ncbi:MAG: nucleotidyl transferase AbiEii/AbiGii toxin family protein [Candidatus Omnitrophica bacterium]|nr:nucleotidyl transferase AbiEii/AbiGii toxin family protein [Candidatus Omnitrophota bacterium]
MLTINIEQWVDQDRENPPKSFRQTVHTILYAIANSQYLRDIMVIKGGILIAILHQGGRYTKDIDFSTNLTYQKFDEESFLREFKKQLARAVHFLPYGLDCRIQRCKIQPNNPEASFPSLKLSIGYAYKGVPQHKRLEAGKAPDTVHIDFSFNEITRKMEPIQISEAGLAPIQAYSLTDLIAEKYRAILQQEIRNRVRRQDAYDIYELLKIYPRLRPEDKKEILESLRIKSESRNLCIQKNSLDNPAIIERCEKEYSQLSAEIDGELPSFDNTYSTVRDFFQSLPWEQ